MPVNWRLDATREADLARIADVLERYRVQVRVRPLLVVGCLMSAYRLGVELLRRRTTSEVMFSRNALDRAIEAAAAAGAHGQFTSPTCPTPAPIRCAPVVVRRVRRVAGHLAAPVTNTARGPTGRTGGFDLMTPAVSQWSAVFLNHTAQYGQKPDHIQIQ